MAFHKPAPSPGQHPARQPGIAHPTGRATPAGTVDPTGKATPPSPAMPPGPRVPTNPGLQLQPIVHVEDMAASVTFYEHLGAELIHGTRDDDWVLLQLGTTQIGLLARPPSPERGECTVELNFCAAMPLDALERRLGRAGVPLAGLGPPGEFGEQLDVMSPDGLLIKIKQREPDRYP
jgi:catechol 2,3-dioxygenase-like lactoylglutathione lyase family enzyme